MLSAGLFVARTADAQVACGETITASLQLTADLSCTGTRGFVIGADKVTIDLNGFTLSGDGGIGDVAIDNGLGFDGVTVKNGTISDFDECISIGGNAQKNVVSGMRLQFCVNDAIDLNDSDLTKITKTTILNSGQGVQILADGTGNIVEKSFILGSAQHGVQVQGSGNVVQKNQLTVHGGDGVHVTGSANRVLGNKVDRMNGDGIGVEGGTGNEVSKNSVAGGVAFGIQVRNAPATRVVKNTVTGNHETNIAVLGTSDGTVVEKNVVRAGTTDGIAVEDAVGVRVDGNTAVGNRLNGIVLVSTSTNPSAAKNTATANLSYGLRANTVAVDGGGNKASANGDGDCLGFVCK